MPSRPLDPKPPRDEGEAIASFGKCQIRRRFDGSLFIIDGSESERAEAREWVAKFFPGELKKLREY
jgi:hypothetical protein